MRLLSRGWLFVGNYPCHRGIQTVTPWCWAQLIGETFSMGDQYTYVNTKKFGFGFDTPLAYSQSWQIHRR